MLIAPSASMEPGTETYLGYTGVAHVLDTSAVALPVGKVDREKWDQEV